MAQPPRAHEDYHIGIICPLAIEKAAMVAMLDETHPQLTKKDGDENKYKLGKIGVHNVVIAGLMGNEPAAIIAENMKRSFPIKLSLMVGVGSGVWSKKDDIRLGDVVVSQPTSNHGGVMQWDFGRTTTEFRQTGWLNRPPPVILDALQELQTFDLTDGVDIKGSLSLMVQNKPHMALTYRYQGADQDRLFEATYEHQGDETCNKCNTKFIVQRPARNNSSPKIHYGSIASGNKIMKHGTSRDNIAKQASIICFEMEAAGLTDDIKCLLIRGICDYADSHKNKIWQPYAAATAAAFARALLGFVDKQEVIKTPSPPKPLMVLPFSRNQGFVGRQSELDRLRAILHTENHKEGHQRAALVGLGGVGKTQIALECAFQLQSISPALSVFWVRASDITSFLDAYRSIGQQLHIPGLENDKADIKRLVKDWLSRESAGKWLMIIDNADDFKMFHHNSNQDDKSSALYECLPYSTLGTILFTTRDREAAMQYAGSNVVDVNEMDNAESKELLQQSLQHKQLINDSSGTTKLLYLLSNLPLAITQAAVYLNTKSCTIAEYLRIYEESSDNVIKLLSNDFEDIRRYPGTKNPIFATWLISFQQIQVRDPLAAEYLAFMSCIKEQDIPRDLLPPGSEIEKIEAIGTLKAFGFIKDRASGISYDMHRLVHLATQGWLKHNDEWGNWNRKTINRISDIFPWPKHENRATWTMYLPHAQCVMATVKTSFSGTIELPWRLLHIFGWCYYLQGNYAEAETMHRQTLQLQQIVLGKDHPDSLIGMNSLGSSLLQQGKYAEAETMQRQTLQLQQMVLGKVHPDTLISMNSLGSSLFQQGKYTEAETMQRQTLQLQQMVLGKDHPDTLISMNSLGSSFLQQGKYAEAETMQRQTLQLQQMVLGKEHPDTLISMNDLGSSLCQQGKYVQAEIMHRQALQLQETVLGKDHPATLMSKMSLANVLAQQSKYAEAETIYRHTLQLQEKVLGKDHPYTLSSINNLANLLSQQVKYSEAEITNDNGSTMLDPSETRPTLGEGRPAQFSWEQLKLEITQLWIDDNINLGKVITIMRDRYGFHASKAQYERQIKKWGLRKNLKSAEWAFIAGQVAKRGRAGKDSQIYLNGTPVPAGRLRKEISRHSLSPAKTIGSPLTKSPVPESIKVLTPPTSPRHSDS